ncbi:acetyl-CoA carboxylase biotin carboxylase subunit family protein [Nonomuraea sp. NPDC050556]|uniref:acetyl-CoA carboxylase biotin carboxylase subunit family protein n=1 Tax=Nonomuraea sp. NPDC050556 TaxID=3364369 RepID=UPI0037987A6C
MRVLIINRRADEFSAYDQHLDHEVHQVVYLTTPDWAAPAGASLVVRLPDLDDHEAVVRAAMGRGRFDAVLAFYEMDLLVAARIRELLDIPGARPSDLLKFRDKPVMKEAVAAAGLRVPRFAVVSTVEEVVRFQAETGGDVIAKPRSGAGSEGCRLIRRGEDAAALLDGADFADLEVEEFVTGPIWHVDGLVREGTMAFVQASSYLGTCYDFLRGAPVGSLTRSDGPAQEMAHFAEQCVKALDLHDGAFHLEAIDTPDGPVFLEVGARVGGGPVVRLMHAAHGVDLLAEWIRIQLGEPPSPLPRSGAAGSLLFPGSPGRRVADVTSLPGAHHQELAPAGHLFTGPPDLDLAAAYYFAAPTEHEVRQAMERALELVEVRLEEACAS